MAFHVTAGIGKSPQILKANGFEQVWKVYLAEKVKEYVYLPVIAVGVIRDPGFA